MGDGYCHDEANNNDCNYDGGDCCGTCVNKDHCSECACLSEDTGNRVPNPFVGNGYCNEETNTTDCKYDGGDCCSAPNLVGDGFCNDETNLAACLFDGGDCCLSSPNTDRCSECRCSTTGVITSYSGVYAKGGELVKKAQIASVA